VLLTIAAVELTASLRRRRLDPRLLRRTAPVLAVGALPLVYFFVLDRVDDDYHRLGVLIDAKLWPAEVLAAALLPLGLVALLAYRLPVRSFQDAAVRWWLPVQLFVYVQPAGTFRNHALEGLALPIAVLVVQGVSGLRLPRRLAVPAVAAVCAAGVAANLLFLHFSVRSVGERPYIEPGEADALRALDDDPRPGGVLAPNPITLLVPGLTGREVWSSGLGWTPDFLRRGKRTQTLFDGDLSPAPARALVRESGVRFLLAGCNTGRVDLRPVLGRLVARTRRFGCARVYVVRQTATRSSASSRGPSASRKSAGAMAATLGSGSERSRRSLQS
jgi:hypothetical protein